LFIENICVINVPSLLYVFEVVERSIAISSRPIAVFSWRHISTTWCCI
jgi:hypothetical protein